MKVLYFTKYSRLGASSRLRSFQYFSYLEENNISITVKPLFDDDYVNAIYVKKSKKILVLKAYINRFLLLFTVFQYDKMVVEKELFPYFFSWFERMLSFLGVKYIVDYDDAIFHNYDLNTNKGIRFLLKHKIDKVMKSSDCVIAGNSYLAQRAITAGAKKVEIIPTVIDTTRYNFKDQFVSNDFIIGWIGSPSTFKYVKDLKSVFERLSEKYSYKIHIVGANENMNIMNMEYFPWAENKEVTMISKFNVGIMPLQNTPWELGKCSYKLIQYMGCGLPVVASPVGMNNEVVIENINGFLANTPNEWYLALEKLIQNRELQNEMGKNGKRLVEKQYNLNEVKYQYLKIIKG